MARQKGPEEKVKTDGWKDTFSDLMNLLLCFFVLLFSMSTINEDKFQAIAASLSQSISILSGGKTGIGEGMLIASGATQLSELSEYYSDLGVNAEGESESIDSVKAEYDMEAMKESEEMADDIEEMLKEQHLSDSIEVQTTTHYVMLTMRGKLLFHTGSAELTDEAKQQLSQVAEILKEYEGNLIEILGHTDNVPINYGVYTSNDVLSTYRALAVFDYLVNDKGLSPKLLKHSGRGEYDPIADNTTEEGRALNRRVEIKIYNKMSSE